MTSQDTSDASQGLADSVENLEQYMLYSKASIIQKLRQLGKSNSMISAHFGGGQHSLLTLVVDVLPDKDLLVLDYGSDEAMNQKLMASERVVFKTNYEGITAQFSCSQFQRAKRHGKSAIACPLPESMLWVQRREFYRVRVPLSESVNCELIQDDESFLFPVLDISIGGLALHYTNQRIELEEGQLYTGSRLSLSDQGHGLINLEVRNIISIGTMNNGGYRIGCEFRNLGMDVSSSIQRYIHHIESLLSRVKHD